MPIVAPSLVLLSDPLMQQIYRIRKKGKMTRYLLVLTLMESQWSCVVVREEEDTQTILVWRYSRWWF